MESSTANAIRREPRSGHLLVISSVRWGYLWQRHQALAAAAAADGWRVDFLEPHPRRLGQVVAHVLGRLRGRIPLSQATAVPAGVTVLPARAWLRRGNSGYDLVLCYVPDRWSLRRARAGGGAIVYDAVLDWARVPRSWYPPVGWRRAERALAAAAAAVTTDSAGARAVLQERGIEALVVDPAADPPFLSAAPNAPRTGSAVYFGAVRDEVDDRLLADLARAGVPIRVVGPVERPEVRRRLLEAGVDLHEPVPVSALVPLVADAEFVLLPYRGDRTASLVPAKFWNCLAVDRWVLTGGLEPPLDEARLVRPGAGAARWRASIDALTGTAPPALAVAAPTWHSRWRTIVAAAGDGERRPPKAAWGRRA